MTRGDSCNVLAAELGFPEACFHKQENWEHPQT